jgi:oligopeptide transport system ATP-binding protein
MPPDPILRVEDLKVHFPTPTGAQVRAVDGVSLTVNPGETLGLVGESGCGKSTTGLAILRMQPVTSGRIVFENTDITRLDQNRMRPIRRRMQMVYQDPYGSLDPRMTVASIVAEPLVVHGFGNRASRR